MVSWQRSVRWGILGTGTIASRLAEGLRSVPDAQLLAIGSRTRAKAEEFADAHAVPRAYESYDDMVKDADIDVVYIATPNFRHKVDCLLALEAGKSVLCEKPFAIDAMQAREVIAAARRKQLFCMEAMWMRFLPAMARLRGLLAAGTVGEIRLVRAELGISKPFAPNNRFFSREMGGGALLTLGVYLVSFAFCLLGKPCRVRAQASFGETGVDEQSIALLRYPGGAIAALTASIRHDLPCEALIVGTRGQIRVHPPLYRPERISVALAPDPTPPPALQRSWTTPLHHNILLRKARSKFDGLLHRLLHHRAGNHVDRFAGNGFNYEAAEVTRCLRAGALESALMPLDETLGIMETIDAIRRETEDANKGEAEVNNLQTCSECVS